MNTMNTNETIRYRFIYRTEGGAYVDVRAVCRPGDAERKARATAKVVAKKLREDEVVCVWMGPEGKRLPPKLREEVLAS